MNVFGVQDENPGLFGCRNVEVMTDHATKIDNSGIMEGINDLTLVMTVATR